MKHKSQTQKNVRTEHQMFRENHHNHPLVNLDLQQERQPQVHFLFPLAIKKIVEKDLPQPKIKCTRQIHLEIHFNLA